MPSSPVTFSDALPRELEHRAYRVIRTVRRAGICHWVMVRHADSGLLMEAECYDRALTNPLVLGAYRKRLEADRHRQLPCLRLPVFIAESERAALFVRPYVRGEPLYQQLLRPGPDRARVPAVVPAVGAVLREILRTRPDSLEPFLPCLYVADDGRVLADALMVGPWIAMGEASRLLGELQNPDASPEAQARIFLRRLTLRLWTGRPEAGPSDVHGNDRVATILRRLARQPEARGWADRPWRRGRGWRLPWPSLAVAAFLVCVLGAGLARRRSERRGVWQGQVYAPGPVSEQSREAPEFSVGTESESRDETVRWPLREAARAVLREAQAGQFAAAGDLVERHRQEVREGAEALLWQQIETELERLTTTEYRRVTGRAREAAANGDPGEALEMLRSFAGACPPGRWQDGATALAGEIGAAATAEHREAGERRAQQEARYERERQHYREWVSRPQPFADRRSMGEAARLADAVTAPEIKRLLQEDIRCRESELLLFGRLLAAAQDARRGAAVKQRCGQALGRSIKGRVTELHTLGLTEVRPETVVEHRWDELQPEQLYRMFAAAGPLILEDAGQRHFHLALFCLGRGLADAAESELAALAGTPWVATAAPFADYQERRRRMLED